jgi:hypothetical protein|tara:strand:- start:277 stop:486 length:210 start_codon:yes stop_codon:yes gene_type:complete
MSVGENIRFNGQEEKEQTKVFPEVPRLRVDLNNLMKKVKEEEKRSKRNNLVISLTVLLAATVIGIVLTL